MAADTPQSVHDGLQHYPSQAPFDAYGNGGFRFAGMSHRGSLLCLPSGIHGWDVASPMSVSLDSFSRVFDELAPPSFLLFGTGAAQVFPALEIRQAFAARLIGFEIMDTGAAARTYNVLLAEKRPVFAALIAVD